jgi:hypothetical protein
MDAEAEHAQAVQAQLLGSRAYVWDVQGKSAAATDRRRMLLDAAPAISTCRPLCLQVCCCCAASTAWLAPWSAV